MTWHPTHRGPWARFLAAEQRAAVVAIRLKHNGRRPQTGSEEWTVYLMPSTQPATYCELRHYLTDGRVARWVIERNGSVSADNDRGTFRELRDVA